MPFFYFFDGYLIATVCVLLVAWLAQAVPTWLYIRRMSVAPQPNEPEPIAWPQIDVIVSVRGGGDDLAEAMRHLLSLDYPNYRAHVVVDHPTDPATRVLSSLQQQSDTNRWDFQFLVDPPRNRSLICSSFVQAFEQLGDETDLIAFCGADMNLPSNFLRNMARPMFDPGVGSTLGNRWYIPHTHSWGSLVRYLWNLGALVPMWMFQIPWGGASALRPKDVRRSGLLDAWKTGMVEDAPIFAAMQKLSLRMAFVPNLLVVTDDAISYGRCVDFLHRQLLWTRLYHTNWFQVVWTASASTVALFWPWCVGVALVFLRGPANGFPYFVIGLCYWLGLFLLILAIDRTVSRVVISNGYPCRKKSFILLAQIALAIPVTQLTYALALTRAMFTKRVAWSGIEYDLPSPHEVSMVRYAPVNSGA